ncbi:MAG: hypothetical protein IT472_11100 [Thermomonas sp.]|uniref:hypothetical protein n=1 Tax=Thermomonas sp. TaxID=1971895 RepID=UPI0026084994|nr:hypothetical protein [Thermomonas sp.]MCC7097715.1 hypothetical protein [Thermomonas sp.]
MSLSILTALLLATQSAPPATASDASPIPYSEAKRQADADEASVTGQAHEDMLSSQGALLDAGIAACARDDLRDDFTPFTIVMKLSKTGMVQQTWRQGTSPLGICLQRYVRDKTVFTPPRDGFFMSFEVSFTK